MYILEVNYGNGEIHRHFLLPGQTYTLGRKECRILLPAAEPSISRHHATVFVAPMPRHSVLDPSAQLEIRIEDMSKHGTFVDGERVGKDNSRFLYPEDRIRLGLRVTARIIPVVLVFAISPGLTDEDLDLVLEASVRTGALVVEDCIPAPLVYYEEHTSCIGFLYVAEEGFRMEEAMMTALGYGYTLVTPEYVAHLVRCLEKKDTLMPGEFPSPSSPSPASRALRSVAYRRPAQTYFSVTEFLSTGRPKAATVFRNQTFVLLESTLENIYSEVLRLFGGAVETVALDTVAAWCSRQSSSPAFLLSTAVLIGEADFHSVSDEVIKRGGGRGSFSTEHARPVICGYLTMYKYGVCLISEENVHIALYRNDPKELNTKSTSRYLQRPTDDVLSDESLSSGGDAPMRMSSGTLTDVNLASGRGGTRRLSESPANASVSPGMKIERAPLNTRRSREVSLVVSRSPSQTENACNTAAAPSSATAVPFLTTASLVECVRSHTGSRSVSPHSGSFPPALDSAAGASEPPRPAPAGLPPSLNGAAGRASQHTSVLPSTCVPAAPPPALLNRARHAPDDATSLLVSLATSAATPAPSPSAVLGGGAGNAARCEDRCTGTLVAHAPTVAPSPTATSPRQGMSSAQRYSHPFSLSSRLRNGGEEGHSEGRGTRNGTGGAPEPEETGVSQGRHRSVSSSMLRSSNSPRRSSVDYASAVPPLNSGEAVMGCSSAGSMSEAPASAAAGDTRGSSSSALVDGRRSFGPDNTSEEPLRSSALGEAGPCRDVKDTKDVSASGGVSQLPRPTYTFRATLSLTANTTATVAAPQRGAQSKRALAQPTSALAASTPESVLTNPPQTKRSTGGAVAKSSEAARQLCSVRRGEQRLSSASASAHRRGSERLSAALRRLHSSGHHSGLGNSMLERGVAAPTPAQAGKSSPRQRSESARVSSVSGRRKSFSRDFELSRATEPSDDGFGRMGNRHAFLRHESLSGANQPLPGSGRVFALTQDASSFQRINSSVLRDMATPRCLSTSHIASSVPRIRCAQAYGSVPRHKSPFIADDGAAFQRGTGDSTEGRVRAASAQRSSICRRRASPTHGNGAFSRAASSSSLSVSGQAPGHCSDSVASAGVTTSSAAAESYVRINKELGAYCESFMSDFLDQFMSDMELTTRSVVRQTYMDSRSKQVLEDGMERVLQLLQHIKATESDIPPMYSTSGTRAACHQARQKSQYTLSKIKACYNTVNCKVPSVLMRARAALSTQCHAHTTSEATRVRQQ
ncbi:hypothetical protein JKF63_05232 [Porcisia hertigi]|uniref:FHA domain-containing protein n=1 Tax=Porcisia hertigi TaxID=2761500 RepID=A0A836IFX8_9TRYP|nr:hypothetical protein JKF63_05232 [Porcisia hertigi]